VASASGKATYSRPDPEEIAQAEAAALALLEAEGDAGAFGENSITIPDPTDQ
jgi:hypothetical protein